ncbi:uncharacterized protein RB166_004598 [Leptodactylus fuscus]
MAMHMFSLIEMNKPELQYKSLEDAFLYRSLRKNIYKSDEFDSGFPSSSTSSCYGILEIELKKEVNRSEKRRSALADSLKNAYRAIEYQKNCLEQQDQYITSSKSTLESLLMRQKLLESRLSNLKHYNFYPDVLSLDVSEKNAPSSRYSTEVPDYTRISTLEREIIDIKRKMRNCGSICARNNVCTQNACEEGNADAAEAIEINKGLRLHAQQIEAKCSHAQREKDVLELQIASLYSGLHQAKATSKGMEKECVKLQSQIVANRNINESLHLEMSALKQHNHTLENAVKGSESENKSLHTQVESLQKEKQLLVSQKELLFEIMKRKGNWKNHSEKLNRRSELNTDIVACYQHLADLLNELECLKMNNVRLDNEKEQILKFLLRTIQDFQDYKTNSESSREQVEKLLNERIDLRENYHKRINQVTAVVIELKHLRKAFKGLMRHSQDPDDKKAMEWISRVQTIKDSLKLLQEEQSLNPIFMMKKPLETNEMFNKPIID